MMRYWETERREARPALASIKVSLLLILLSALGGNLSAQSFDRKVFSPGGSTFSLNGQEYGFTFGEPIIGTDLLTTPYLTKGFQQPEPLVLLPVNVTLHDVRQQGESDQLIWSTSQIEQTSYFDIELAVGSGDFSSFQTMLPSSSTSYQENIEAPKISGPYRYRVSQVMYDGTSVLSNYIEINRTAIEWSITPNPANTNLYISGSLPESGVVEVLLFDLHGKQIFEEKTNSTSGSFHTKVRVEEYPEGIYLLNIKTLTSIITRRVLVRH